MKRRLVLSVIVAAALLARWRQRAIDAFLFWWWRHCTDLTPSTVRVYIRGEREFAEHPDFLRHYRRTTWEQMTPREQRFTKHLGWTTP